MIKIEKTEVLGWEAAIRGMRNPMNSWDKSDSGFGCYTSDQHFCGVCEGGHTESCPDCFKTFKLGPNDHDLMMRLAKGGPVHAKYRRMIQVYVDITAPLYWWKEFDTYKVGTVANSCSTMHKIHAKEFTLDDFSTDHMDHLTLDLMGAIICKLNANRNEFLSWSEDDNTALDKKHYWWQMIQLLPSSYNQKRTIDLSYEVLVGMYRDRKNHKLDEWHVLCDWIEGLPYSELITGGKDAE